MLSATWWQWLSFEFTARQVRLDRHACAFNRLNHHHHREGPHPPCRGAEADPHGFSELSGFFQSGFGRLPCLLGQGSTALGEPSFWKLCHCDVHRGDSLLKGIQLLVAAFEVKNEWCDCTVTLMPLIAFRGHCRDEVPRMGVVTCR